MEQNEQTGEEKVQEDKGTPEAPKKPKRERPADRPDRNKDKEKEKPPERRRKYIPAILMLFGGAVGSITTFCFGYPMNVFLGITLLCLILFYIGGCLYVFMLDRFDEQIEKARMDEGEVIEKEGEEGEAQEPQGGEGTQNNAEV